MYSKDDSIMSQLWSKLKKYNRNQNIRLIRLLKEGVFTAAYPLHDVGNLKEINLYRNKRALKIIE